MTEQYIRTALQLGWLLQGLEQSLTAAADGCLVDAEFVRSRLTNRLPTQEEIAAAMEALVSLGILQNDGGFLRLNKGSLRDTNGFRSGVSQTLGVMRSESTGTTQVHLCVAVPPGLDTAVAERLSQEAGELRAAILEIIASAKSQLILASPFWDQETTDEIADFLAKRLDAGVAVTVLGRFSETSTETATVTLRRLAHHDRCTVLSWFSPSQGDHSVQTFHFKAAVADEGKTAYLGSANLTTSGLRSRMEFGVILSGEAARQLYRIITAALSLARPAF